MLDRSRIAPLLAASIAVLFVVRVGGAVSSTPVSAKTYRAERYDVAIAVEPDRSLLVSETVVFRFEGGPFTDVDRGLRRDGTDGISGIAALMDGTTLAEGRGPGSYRIRRENGVQVTWRFAPTSDSVHTFELRYRLSGVVTRSEASDDLVYVPLPVRYSYPIDSSTIRISYPETARPLANPAVVPGSTEVAAQSPGFLLRTGRLAPGTRVEFRLRFAPGAFSPGAPRWQAREERGRVWLPVFGIVASVILVAGLLGLGVFAMAHRRPPTASDEGLERPAPPDTLPVALAGTLLQVGAQPSWAQAFGTLLDLARRGIVTIEQVPRSRRGQDFLLRRPAAASALRPHERGLVELLFLGKRGWDDSVKLSSIRQQIASRWKRFREPVREELRASGLLDPAREATRRALQILAIVLFAAGGAGFIWAGLLVDSYGPSPLLIPGSVVALAVVTIIVSTLLSPLSESGDWTRSAWLGYERYLKRVARGETPVSDPGLFDRSLPYAAAFGVAQQWVKTSKKQGQAVAPPEWFRALAAAGHDNSAAFAAFIATSSHAGVSGGTGGGAAAAAGGGVSGAH